MGLQLRGLPDQGGGGAGSFIRTANGIEVYDNESVELSNRGARRAMRREALTAIFRDENAVDSATEYSVGAYDEEGKLVMQARASIDITDQ